MKDLVIIITDTDATENPPHSTTIVYRYDLDGSTEDLIKHIELYEHLIEGGKMFNK